MTEAEWMACDDPHRMLEFVRGKASDRNFRLFQVACCRRVWHLMPFDYCHKAVLIAERYADGEASDRARQMAQKKLRRPIDPPGDLIKYNAAGAAFEANHKTVGRHIVFLGVAMVIGREATRVAGTEALGVYQAAYQAEERAEASLVRCICGNPLRPISVSPSWLTWNDGAVRKMAQVIYDDRAFNRLPLLADAVEDAGCDDADILSHCRGPGEHVRGCWVVDLLLGKS